MTDTATHRIPWFDGHCDTVSRCARMGWDLRENAGHLDLVRLDRYQKAAQVFALFADRDRYDPGALPDECRRQRDIFAGELEKNRDVAVLCREPGDVAAANGAGKIAALLSIEGGELLNCDPGRLEEARAWGVRLVNITWNHANDLSGSNTDEPARGLGPLGRTFVRRAEELGILMDVSHLSDQGFWDLERLTSRPLVATHSNSRAVCRHSRNLTDDMFRAIRDSGGVAGLNLCGAFVGRERTLDDLVRHVEHFMDLEGASAVALGGDWDGCDLACGWRGAQDAVRLWDALAARGYGRTTLEDIFYNNWQRVLDREK